MYKFLYVFLFFINFGAFSQKPVFENIKLPEGISTINSLKKEGDSIIWVATNHGLVKVTENNTALYFDEKDPSLFKINCIAIDNNKTKWLGTYRSSVIKFISPNNYKEIKVIEKTNGKPQLITSVIAYKNLIYFTTCEGFIFCYDSNSEKISTIESPTKNSISAFIIDGETGTYWLACIDGLFFKTAKAKWKLKSEFSLVYGIYFGNEKYWAVGRDAEDKAILMLLFDNGQLMSKKIKVWKEFKFNYIPNAYTKFNSVDITDKEIVWIACEDGILRFNPTDGTSILYKLELYPKMGINNIQNIMIQKYYIWYSSSGNDLYRMYFTD